MSKSKSKSESESESKSEEGQGPESVSCARVAFAPRIKLASLPLRFTLSSCVFVPANGR